MRESVPSSRFVTQTHRESVAIPYGATPTGMRSISLFVAGLILETDASPSLVTQTELNPAAIDVGLSPTGMVSTTRVADLSSRLTVPWLVLTAQTESAVRTRPSGSPPTFVPPM